MPCQSVSLQLQFQVTVDWTELHKLRNDKFGNPNNSATKSKKERGRQGEGDRQNTLRFIL